MVGVAWVEHATTSKCLAPPHSHIKDKFVSLLKYMHNVHVHTHTHTQTLCHYTKQLLEALSYLHSQGIVHNDLRPSLVFLDGGGVKLGGFSIVKRYIFAYTHVLSMKVP